MVLKPSKLNYSGKCLSELFSLCIILREQNACITNVRGKQKLLKICFFPQTIHYFGQICCVLRLGFYNGLLYVVAARLTMNESRKTAMFTYTIYCVSSLQLELKYMNSFGTSNAGSSSQVNYFKHVESTWPNSAGPLRRLPQRVTVLFVCCDRAFSTRTPTRCTWRRSTWGRRSPGRLSAAWWPSSPWRRCRTDRCCCYAT